MVCEVGFSLIYTQTGEPHKIYIRVSVDYVFFIDYFFVRRVCCGLTDLSEQFSCHKLLKAVFGPWVTRIFVEEKEKGRNSSFLSYIYKN